MSRRSTKLRVFATVRVTNTTGKPRKRRVTARRGKTLDELVDQLARNVKGLTDPVIRSILIDVRTPPTGEMREFLEDGIDGEFAWNHCAEATARAVELLRPHFPELRLEAGHIYDV